MSEQVFRRISYYFNTYKLGIYLLIRLLSILIMFIIQKKLQASFTNSPQYFYSGLLVNR